LKKLFPFQPGLSAEESKNIWERWFKAVVAFIPAAILGFLLDDFIEAKLFNTVTVSIALLVGGIILYWIESRRSAATFDSVEKMSYTTAFFVGLIQCLAMIPGTSRSAATIIGAMLLGASRPAAAEFSFFLAIPTIAAASGYKLLKAGFDFTSSQWMTLGVGFVVSFAVAYWVVSVFMKFISTNDFKPFAYYRIVLGVILLALLGLGVLG
jgi:undecaprenyl-diphosphatase